MNAELRAAYATVITARREAEIARAYIPWHAKATASYMEAVKCREDAELVLREMALAIFAETGKEHIAPGVTVHVRRLGEMPYAVIARNLNDFFAAFLRRGLNVGATCPHCGRVTTAQAVGHYTCKGCGQPFVLFQEIKKQ